MRRKRSLLVALALLGVLPLTSRADVVYSDGFTTNTSGNYTVTSSLTKVGGTPTSDAAFQYDYSALGIPAAPHTTDGSTLGLRLRTDNLANTNSSTPATSDAVGDITVATKGLTLTAPYSVTADVWGNYIGGNTTGTGLASSGSNGTTGAGLGIGTAGTGEQSPNANDGFMAGMIHDGGTPTYRAYVHTTNAATTTGYFAAGPAAGSNNASNAYYNFLGTHTAPTVQTTASPTQQGTTPNGTIAFAWHTVTLTNDGTNITWSIDGTTIATVPDSAVGTFGGSNVSLSAFDTGLTGNSTAANQLYNADIWDNLVVTQTPEPTCLGLLGAGSLAMLARRRRRA